MRYSWSNLLIVATIQMVIAAAGHPQQPIRHGPPSAQNIAIPAYFSSNSLWMQMRDGYPAVGMAILNVDNGPGNTLNRSQLEHVKSNQAAGVLVLGYVYTRHGHRDIAQVEADVNRYFQWYGVNGIFFDEANTNCAYLPTYYTPLYDYVKGIDAQAIIALNPGSPTAECYMTATDILVTFEGDYSTYTSARYAQPAWIDNYPTRRFWQLIFDAPTTQDMQDAITLARARRAGWVYVTPARLHPGPWNTLPERHYWSAELNMMR